MTKTNNGLRNGGSPQTNQIEGLTHQIRTLSKLFFNYLMSATITMSTFSKFILVPTGFCWELVIHTLTTPVVPCL